MSKFFAEELNVDIDAHEYRDNGDSKAKRLRCFLTKVDAGVATRALRALWAYREEGREASGRADWASNAEGRFLGLLQRINGEQVADSRVAPPLRAYDFPMIAELKARLLALSGLDPQQRGYAFETWLRDTFNFFGLEARGAFRLTGEQIDGSFMLQGELYLLEAKWQGPQTGVADLHVFEGKLAQKAAWTRGLFISHSGFTADGLEAFGRGKRTVCMDGLDLYEILNRELPLDQALIRKVRNAAETGRVFERISELFVRG